MTKEEAVQLIHNGIPSSSGIWADVGAGTGMFTTVLQSLLTDGKIYAVDKNPHALWSLQATQEVAIEIVEADFNEPMDLPALDGIIMANALHYAPDPLAVIKNVTRHLKSKGIFILVEYETETPRPPWVPYPVSFDTFRRLCTQAALMEPVYLGKIPSIYGDESIYAAKVQLA